ncbi:hypothetical protein KH5_18440 [Urechidicola sp. KH5]
MRNQFITIVIAACSLLFFSSFSHPLKLTSSLIKYDVKSKEVTIECNVFIDDFAPVFSDTLEDKINSKSITTSDKEAIENYFKNHFKIVINEERLGFKFDSYMVRDNVMSIKFKEHIITINKGDEIYIENELLFDEFLDLQSNWITLRMPPFIKNSNFECNIESSYYTKTF